MCTAELIMNDDKLILRTDQEYNDFSKKSGGAEGDDPRPLA